MKFCFAIALMLCGLALSAQTNEKLYGKWIKVRTLYKNGSELADNDLMKYNYTKYTFSKPDECTIALKYNDWSEHENFTLGFDELLIKNDKGYVINQLKIEKLDADTLVLVQENNGEQDDLNTKKFYFVPESAYQKANPLTADDIVSVKGKDTLYRESEKLYPDFNGEASFHIIQERSLGGLQGQTPINTHFLATFIVNKDGVADSLKIIEGINPNFDKQYIKTFTRFKNHWVPATSNGKAVNVLVKDEIRFLTTAIILDRTNAPRLADDAMKVGNYNLAIYYYTKALKTNPYSGEYYYKRAFCYLANGNGTEACADLQQSKQLGTYAANGLIKRFCQ